MDLSSIRQTLWDAAVIGAGPAGSAAACALAKKGFSVLLIDKETFPRKKVCGACLNERSLAVLDQMGLAEAVRREHPVPLSSFHFAHRGREVRLLLKGGVSISRERFDWVLAHEARQAGAVFLEGTQAFVGNLSGGLREVSFRTRDEQGESVIRNPGSEPGVTNTIRARVVIAADGLSGSSLNRLKEFHPVAVPKSRFGAGLTLHNAPSFYQSGVIYMAVEKEGYAGAVRLEDGRLNIAAALDASILKKEGSISPASAVARIFRGAGFDFIPELEHAETRGTPPLTRRRRVIASERLIVIGDSAGYVEPFTGEGMEWALRTAQAAAEIAGEGVREWKPVLVKRWNSAYHALVRQRQLFCRLISLALRNEIILNFGMKFLSGKPERASGLVSWIHGVSA